MAKKKIHSVARLREIIRYDPATGMPWWIERKRGRNRHKPAGQYSGKEYPQIIIEERYYYIHILAYALMTGEWPDEEVDHVNGNKHDNKWSNLRAATPAQQKMNCGLYKSNTSGHPGVCWDKSRDKWVVRVGVTQIGRFDSFDAAVEARERATDAMFGEFKRPVALRRKVPG